MATRPSPRSDAEIRELYRRGKRRSPRAQEIAEDLERTGVGETLAISRWNRGEDPTLNTMSRANAAVAARGFSAASADRGRAMQAVDEALQAEPSSDLPPVAREMYGRQRDRLIGNAEEFLRDADEYSGRPRSGKTMEYQSSGREVKQPGKTSEYRRQGVSDGPLLRPLSAEDYWEQNPTSSRTAVVKDWSRDPEVAAAIATGNVSAIEQATKNARDRDRVGRGLPKGPGTTEGDAAVASRNSTRTEIVSSDPNGPTVTTSRPTSAAAREVDLMDLRAEADRRAKADKSRPDMEKFNATAPEREKRRKENEEAGAQRFAKFVADNEMDKRKVAQAEGYLKTYRQQAANLRQSAAESALDGRERSGEFWQEVENANYNMSYLDSVPREEQLQWALDQLKEEEESRERIDRAARASTSEQEPLISAFTGTSGGTISELLPGYFSNINIR